MVGLHYSWTCHMVIIRPLGVRPLGLPCRTFPKTHASRAVILSLQHILDRASASPSSIRAASVDGFFLGLTPIHAMSLGARHGTGQRCPGCHFPVESNS